LCSLAALAELGAGDEAREGVQMARIISPAKRWGRRLAIVPALAMLAVFVVALPSQALAGFQSCDGNLDPATGCAGTVDWNSFASGTPSGYDALTTVPDNIGNPDDIYAGGTKQDDDCPTVNPSGSLGGGNGKFDMERIYLTHHKATVGSVTHDILYLAWERVPSSATASAHIAYEFNHGSTACGSSSDDLVKRSTGDKLIEYDFEGGTASSTSPTLQVATWITSGTCQVSNNTPPCWGNVVNLNTAGVSDAAVNSVTVGTVTDTIQNPDESLAPVQFGEAGIDLQAAGIDPCALNGQVTGVSRSSGDAGTAQMKDKVGPAPFTLAACTQNTTITTQVSLDDHATINSFDNPNIGSHTGTLKFELLKPGATCSTTTAPAASDVVYETHYNNVGSVATGSGPFSTSGGSNSAGSYTVPSTASAQGTYTWRVTFSGDSANNASGSCSETVNVQYGLV
jgi:hypothetical protein